MPIPPLIFQTWKSKTDIPPHFAHWSRTFRDQNPACEHLLWDDADNRAFIAAHYPWFLEKYDAYPAEIFRADAVRYFFLYHHGGVYADMDTECLSPLDSLLEMDADVVLGTMGTDANFAHAVPNVVMLSAPRQPFWLLMMSLLREPPPDAAGGPEHVTGPVILKRALKMYKEREADASVRERIEGIRARLPAQLAPASENTRIALLAGHNFYPLAWNDMVHSHVFCRPLLREGRWLEPQTARAFFPNSYTVTYWAHSWGPREVPAWVEQWQAGRAAE